MIDRFVADLRYALRILRRNPGFATTATLVLSLGIGANTAFFGLVDALLFKPLPVRAPEQLVRVATSGTDGAMSYAEYLDYRSGAKRTLAGLLAFTANTLEYLAEGSRDSESIAAYLVTDDYFEVLGVQAALGRYLPPHPEAGEPPAVVLSNAFWRTHFAADPRIVGRTLWLNRASFVVAGVAPPTFAGTLRGGSPQVYVPFRSQIPAEELLVRGRRDLIAIGRLQPHASAEAARAELLVVAQQMAARQGLINASSHVAVVPENEALFLDAPPLRHLVSALFAMFGLVQIVACANLAGLLTARATFRRREIAMRATLGASRRVLVDQLVTESLVLACLGCAGGLLVGVVARNGLWAWLQTAIVEQLGLEALWIDTGLDARVALFTLVIALGSTLLFGLAPAWHASTPQLYGRAQDDPTAPTPAHVARLRFLVTGQVTLSVVLLGCSVLLVQTVRQATSADLGHPLDRVLVATLNLSAAEKGTARLGFERALDRARALPGVEDAALGGGGWPGYLPQSMTPGRPRQNYVFTTVGARFLQTLRIPLVSGRDFDARDVQGSTRVAILNERLAEALWPGQTAVGRKLALSDVEPPFIVVGVAHTVRAMPIGPPFFQIYAPLGQHDVGSTALHVRASPGFEEAIRRQLPGELRALNLGLPSIRVRSLAAASGSLLALPRAAVTALAALGLIALVLAAVGLYGTTAYVAGRRARECGIRRVLGASGLSVFRLLIAGSMRAVGAGLGLGVLVSLAAGLLMKAAFLGTAFDPLALLVAPLLLAATAFAAVCLPALRATSVEPVVVLREE